MDAAATAVEDAFEVVVGNLTLSRCTESDLEVVREMESRSYPADEAATAEALAFRRRVAGEFFVVARERGKPDIVGYVCGTLSDADALTHASMSSHEPSGSTLCVHSVVTRADARRRGVGGALLRAYVDDWVFRGLGRGMTSNVRAIRLLCKRELLEFYRRGGFRRARTSDVRHGADEWHECVRERDAT